MEALRYIQKITSDSIIIKHVEKYIGQNAEIIIIPLGMEDNNNSDEPKSVMGIFHKYANPDLIKDEKDAWAKAVEKKHGNS